MLELCIQENPLQNYEKQTQRGSVMNRIRPILRADCYQNATGYEKMLKVLAGAVSQIETA